MILSETRKPIRSTETTDHYEIDAKDIAGPHNESVFMNDDGNIEFIGLQDVIESARSPAQLYDYLERSLDVEATLKRLSTIHQWLNLIPNYFCVELILMRYIDCRYPDTPRKEILDGVSNDLYGNVVNSLNAFFEAIRDNADNKTLVTFNLKTSTRIKDKQAKNSTLAITNSKHKRPVGLEHLPYYRVNAKSI